MQKKKCLFCGVPVEKEWSFCPQCGRPLRTQGINISGLNIDVTKMVNELIPQVLNGVFNGSIFTNKQQESQQSHESSSKQSFSAKEIIEPEDLVSKHGDTVIHAISLPGVRTKNDIDIRKMENSIEVRAKNGDKLYLKIVRRDKKQSVISEEFANENLVLVLRKLN
ncbi:zinc ribbon domain-containing protein [Candidatus Parvarchaeota archaeon]|jgi:HSP20 family molecular chaperone IbpA|nr:zinc ribbon domain-containing protein [Candidatus Parvarchaeota archaeon]